MGYFVRKETQNTRCRTRERISCCPLSHLMTDDSNVCWRVEQLVTAVDMITERAVNIIA